MALPQSVIDVTPSKANDDTGLIMRFLVKLSADEFVEQMTYNF
jgi:hypothetical protein